MNPLEFGMRWLSAICRSRLLITLSLAAVALAIAAAPGAARLWQYHRDAILSGQWWRALTGHFTHWSVDHAAWDLAMFAALGTACERISPRRFVLLIAVSALTISAALLWLMPGLKEYRGLSGIDSGLFVFLATAMLRVAWQARDRAGLAIGALLLAAFVGKVAYEIAAGTTIFVDARGAGFVPLPLAHAIGATCGVLVALAPAGALGARHEPGCNAEPARLTLARSGESTRPREFPAC